MFGFNKSPYSSSPNFLIPEKTPFYKKISASTILIVIFVVSVIYLIFSVAFKKNSSIILNPFLSSDDKSDSNSDKGNKVQNPLTGEYVSEEEAKEWQNKRPVAFMINNHISARPQSGLSQADLIYEIVAEGGITRFSGFFLGHSPEKVGPIRSTREYYLVLVKELGDAMLMHIGWSPQALEAIENWPVRSLIRLGLNCEQILDDPKGENCWRNLKRVEDGVAWEHTAYGNATKLRKTGEENGWTGSKEFRTWKFKDDKPISTLIESADPCSAGIGFCKPISIDFWYKGDYSANFKYDPQTNMYLRFTGYDDKDMPIPTIDENNGEQVRVKNLIVQFVPEKPIAGDEKNRLAYQFEGSGQAKIFIDGRMIEATWNKSGRDERVIFFDTDGQEIEFNRGRFWISVVSDKNVDQVVY